MTDAIARIEAEARARNTREGYRRAAQELLDLPEGEDDVPYVEDAITRMNDYHDSLAEEEP